MLKTGQYSQYSEGGLQNLVGPMEQSKNSQLHNWAPIQVPEIYTFELQSIILFRKYDSLFKSLSRAEVQEVTRITGCQKPCRYNKYIIVGERRRTTFESKDFTFSLWAVSNRTEIRKEELIYPLSSLVADFGGTLGLFLGFSFMTLWDQIQFLGYFTGALKMCRGDFFRHTN